MIVIRPSKFYFSRLDTLVQAYFLLFAMSLNVQWVKNKVSRIIGMCIAFQFAVTSNEIRKCVLICSFIDVNNLK